MTKFGVGVGEEFPLDEQNRTQQEGEPDHGETHRCGRGGHHEGHDAWHQFRDQMRTEWRARRRAFRHSRAGRDGADVIEELRRPEVQKFVIGGLALIGLAALLSLLQSRR